MSYGTENQLGFVGIDKDSVEVRNYGDTRIATKMSVNSETRDIELDPEETAKIDVALEQGRNKLELPPEGFSPDNEAFAYLPEDQKIGVEYRGPENRYLETALDEINSVEASNEGELLVLNEEDESAYSSDRPKILIQGSSIHWANNSEVKNVELDSPYNAVFESEVYNIKSKGVSWSDPKNALFKQDETVYYNLDDSKLNNEFIYPVIWKDMIHYLIEPATFESSNARVKFSEASRPSFNDSKAFNYFNREESDLNPNKLDSNIVGSTVEQNQAQIISTVLLLLLSLETLLILERGVYQ